MNYSKEIEDFVGRPFFNNVIISPLGNKVLYSFSKSNSKRDRFVQKIGYFNIEKKVNKTLTDESFSVSSPKWSSNGEYISYIQNDELVIVDANTDNIYSKIQLKDRITQYVWGNDNENIWIVAEKRCKENTNGYLSIGEFNIPAQIYKWNLRTGICNEFLNEDNGSITSIYSSKNKLYYTWKENDIYDYPSVIKVIDENIKEVNEVYTKKSISIIQILDIRDNILLYLGYDQYPSNSCMVKKIHSIDLNSGEVELFSTTKFERGVSFEATKTNGFLIMKESCGTKTAIYTEHDFDSNKEYSVDKCLSHISVSDNGYVSFVMQDFNEAPDIYISKLNDIYNVEKYDSLNLFNIKKNMFNVQIINWESHDYKKIEGILIEPTNKMKYKKKPLVVITTGRSNAFTRASIQSSDLLGGNDKFPYPIEIFSNMGYYTLLANCRSNVYHEYESLSHKSNMTMDGYCLNVIDGIKHVTNLYEDIDKDRTAILGWSLGGYVAARISSWPGNNIKTTIIGNAVTNLMSMYSCSNCFEFNAFMRGGFWNSKSDLESYLNVSPIKYINNIQGSTLIQHGSLDPSMPVEQGREYYYALRLANKKVKMTEFSKLRHVFDIPQDLSIASSEVIAWLDENL